VCGKLAASDAPLFAPLTRLKRLQPVIVIPTADLRGSFVYAPIGNHGRSATRAPVDAAATHRAFTALGFRHIHLYDVDSDSGSDQNEWLIAEIARDAAAEIIVSGGPISEDRIDRLLDVGVSQVIVGLGQGDDRDALARIADSFPGRLIARTDVVEAPFGRRSPRRQITGEMLDLAIELSSLPLAGLAVHGASSDGFQGEPLRFIEDLAEASSLPIFCRTEAAAVGELRALDHHGVAATVLGSSLFDGQLDAQAVAHHFDS